MRKVFIPWSEGNTPPPAFLKSVIETQEKIQKNFWGPFWTKIWNLILGLNNPCKCPKLAKLAYSQLTKELNLQTTTTYDNRETVNHNIFLTIRNMEAQATKQPRPQQAYRKIDQKSHWSDSEDEKDDQARSKSY